MGRPAYGARTTCESCKSIDVRLWHREGWLRAGQRFSCSWTREGAPSGSISVQTEADAVLLTFQYRSSTDTECESVQQRVPITWTACHLGGRRPWFRCTVYTGGRYCGRRVALCTSAGKLFACRRSHDASLAQPSDKRHGLPVSHGGIADQALSAWAPTVEPQHVGGDCDFVDKYEVSRVKKESLARASSTGVREPRRLACALLPVGFF